MYSKLFKENKYRIEEIIKPVCSRVPSLCGGSCATRTRLDSVFGISVIVNKNKKHPFSDDVLTNKGRYFIDKHSVKFISQRRVFYAHMLTRHMFDANTAENPYDGRHSSSKNQSSVFDEEFDDILYHCYWSQIKNYILEKNFICYNYGGLGSKAFNLSQEATKYFKSKLKYKTALFVVSKTEKKLINKFFTDFNGEILWQCEHTNSVHDAAKDYLISYIVRFK